MAQKPLYDVRLPSSQEGKLIMKQSNDINQTRLDENFKRINEMMSELYDRPSGGDTPIVQQSELFWCEYGITPYSEVKNAISEGKIPVVQSPDGLFQYAGIVFTYSFTNNNIFYFCAGFNNAVWWIGCQNSSNMWYANSRTVLRTDEIESTLSSSSTNSKVAGAKATYDSTHYKAGDSFDIAGGVYSGIITSSATSLRFFIPTSKNCSGLNWSVNTLTGGIRTPVGGYISDGSTGSDSSNWVTGSNVSSVSATGLEHGIRIVITGKKAFSGGGIANNMCISVNINSISILAS